MKTVFRKAYGACVYCVRITRYPLEHEDCCDMARYLISI